jgi:hypothetical protein
MGDDVDLIADLHRVAGLYIIGFHRVTPADAAADGQGRA